MSTKTTSRAPFRFVPSVRAVPGAPHLAEALSKLRRRPGLALLDSASGAPRRFSLLVFDPLETERFATDRPASVALRERLGWLRASPGDALPGPFAGGFVGALAYDLGVEGERAVDARPEPFGFPPLVGGLYCDFLVRDEVQGETWLVLGEDPGDARASLEERRDEILTCLAEPEVERAGPRSAGPLRRHTASAEHLRRIEAVRERIAAGDIYQANLAHRFTKRMSGHPVDLYLRLRSVNPAPYMAYLAWEGGALLSASPELLFEYDGDEARTRPIKGTICRGKTQDEDRELERELLSSEKDLAELSMIVDLERNDLGRIARTGTVRVEGLASLETYASVHHLTADVAARVREGLDAMDVLRALFPGGSITGAPKLSSMRVIAELEGEGRGFFTGSLGFLDTRGRAAFNILIRTLLWRPSPDGAGEVSFRVGGGITWSSDAEAEDRETLAKGEALAASLAAEGEDPWDGMQVQP